MSRRRSSSPSRNTAGDGSGDPAAAGSRSFPPVTDDQWLDERTFTGADFDPEPLVAAKRAGEHDRQCLSAGAERRRHDRPDSRGDPRTLDAGRPAGRRACRRSIPAHRRHGLDRRGGGRAGLAGPRVPARVRQRPRQGRGDVEEPCGDRGDIIVWLDSDLVDSRRPTFRACSAPCWPTPTSASSRRSTAECSANRLTADESPRSAHGR